MANAPVAFTALAIIAQFVAYGPAEELQASGVVLVMLASQNILDFICIRCQSWNCV
jgi:hypothetical protein